MCVVCARYWCSRHGSCLRLLGRCGDGFGGGDLLGLVGLMLPAYIGLGHVVGSGAGMGWVGLGMVIWGILWVGVYSPSVLFVVVARCRVLVFLGSRFILWLGAECCVSGGRLVLVGFLSCVSMWVGYERLSL